MTQNIAPMASDASPRRKASGSTERWPDERVLTPGAVAQLRQQWLKGGRLHKFSAVDEQESAQTAQAILRAALMNHEHLLSPEDHLLLRRIWTTKDTGVIDASFQPLLQMLWRVRGPTHAVLTAQSLLQLTVASGAGGAFSD